MTFTPGASPARRRGSRRGFAAFTAALLLAGLAGGAWYSWRSGWLHPPAGLLPAPPVASPSATTAAIVTQGNLIATNAALADATARLTALQQRLAELNQQTMAASGQASRAEALLVAFAVRRAVERGQPLGYLETSLRIRFGENQPTAVDRVVSASQKPVTLGALTEQFADLQPRLSGGPSNEGTLDWMSRQFGSLFIIRHDDMPSPAPEARLSRARAALAGGRVDLAVAEVERMPGKDNAADWLSHAREYLATQQALDQLESSALSTPTVAPPVATPEPAATATPAAKPNAAPAKPNP